MEQKTKKNVKTVAIILFSIVVALAGIGWYVLSRLEAIVLTELEKNTEEMTDGLYHLKVHKLNINIFNGYLSAKNISIHPDSARLAHLSSVDSLPKNYSSIDIKEIELKGVNFKKKTQDRGRHLDFSLISVKSPQISITNNGFDAPDSVKNKEASISQKTLYEIISPVFEQIKVKNIRLDNGSIEYRLARSSDTAVYMLKNINFHAEDFVVDSTSYARSRVLYCEDFQFQVENIHHILPGKAYVVSIGKVGLGIKDSSFTVEKIALLPQYSKHEFAYKVDNHPDWMDLSIGRVALKGVHFRDIIENKRINIDSIRVEDVNFQNFKNQKIVIVHRKMPLLYEPLQRLSFPVDIRNIQAKNINVVYEELAKNGSVPGLIRFTQMEGEFQGLTNIVSSHSQMNKLVAKGKLMNQGQINATIYFPVDSLNDRFEIAGTLGSMPMISLNSIIEPMAPARLKSGFIKNMDYHIIGGKYRANINMQLLYNDLSVDILKENNDKSKSTQGVFSFLANGLIKHDNPDEGKEPRRIQSEWVRDPYHSSFNYLWKIYCSGLVETVGFSKQKKSQVSWIKNEIDKIKGKNKKNSSKK